MFVKFNIQLFERVTQWLIWEMFLNVLSSLKDLLNEVSSLAWFYSITCVWLGGNV
jgi:hypothetical protein